MAQLTPEQEKEIVRDRKLLLVAVCVLNHLTLEQIIHTYTLSKTECIQLLLMLDRIKFLELLPNNRVKLLVARTFLAPQRSDPSVLPVPCAKRVLPLSLRRRG